MTFSAITDPDTLSTFVEFATAVTEEAVLHLGTDELALTARDPANVALVDLTLEDPVFECVFIGSVDGSHNPGRVYSYPRGRLCRVPVEKAGEDS